jgi:hypothetical protein
LSDSNQEGVGCNRSPPDSSDVRFADTIRAGVVKINQETAGLEFHVPFGGLDFHE